MTRLGRGLRDLQAQRPPERTRLSKVAEPTALIPEEDLTPSQNKCITFQAGQVRATLVLCQLPSAREFGKMSETPVRGRISMVTYSVSEVPLLGALVHTTFPFWSMISAHAQN